MVGELLGFGLRVDKDRSIARLRWLLDAGASYFIDLSYLSSSASETYESTLLNLAGEYGKDIKYVGIPTSAQQLPRKKIIQFILDLIDEALEQGHTVYIHDAYRNVTEIVLGCYFVRRGMSSPEALKELARIRQGSLDGWRRAPAQERARRLVRKWDRSVP